MNISVCPPGTPVLEVIAREWIAQAGGLGDPLRIARGTLLLPTRRAARALADAFLRITNGAPLLLPRIIAIGALDEAPLAMAGALDLPPAIDVARRQAELARLVLAAREARNEEQAWRLAGDLATLMDEAERTEVDLARLPDAADPEFAAHWQRTLKFLGIVTEHWPRYLADNGLMNSGARRVALIDATTAALRTSTDTAPIWAAGMTSATPVLTRLLQTIAALPHGRVILPSVDTTLPDDVWNALPDAHPHAGQARLLHALNAPRQKLPMQARADFLSLALRPAEALDAWNTAPLPQDATQNLFRLSPEDAQHEAIAIALILRETLETPDATAALVTPDRDLARRVAAELARYGVVADDSAGESLNETPPAVFLRLLAHVVATRFAPIPLLALLKHPMAALGLAPSVCRDAARALELLCLHGPRPPSGLGGLKRTLDLAREDRHKPKANADAAADLIARLEAATVPLLRTASAIRAAPADLLRTLAECAEAIATSDDTTGPERIWAWEEGDALATHLATLADAFQRLPDMDPRSFPLLLDAALEGPVVRSRRALRGREGNEHPRIHIWGLMEAQLQSADTIVLGGLIEGVWPPATDPGPWMSRPMRRRIGLPSPEDIIGQAAHDFMATACAAPRVVLSAPRKRDGAPAVPARWLARIDALLSAHGRALGQHPAQAWARMLDEPASVTPVAPPSPRPPAHLRPRRLSVTEIETWLADPYAIYAKHVLKLRALDPIDQDADHSDYGSIVHAALHKFADRVGIATPPDMAAILRAAMEEALTDQVVRPALAAYWRPRLMRIADWVAAREADRRTENPLTAIAPEVPGKCGFPGDFTLTGRADRIEQRRDGSVAILDFKTGTVPLKKHVQEGRAPQLPLEAAMVEVQAFGATLGGRVAELLYWRLTGGRDAGEEKSYFATEDDIRAAAEEARTGLIALIGKFSSEDQPYLAQPNPDFTPRYSDYTQLARVAEWAAGDDA